VNKMKKLLVTLFKVAISASLIAYLIWDATRGAGKANVFANLRDQPKNWWSLAGAWFFCAAAVLLTFVRWWYLVRALGIPCRFAAAIRICFWGYLFNLAPLGIVGGDLVKAVMLAHEQPRYRAKAVASVIVDRVIGLYLLFIVGSAAILLTGLWRIPGHQIQVICRATFIITFAGTLGIAVMLAPGETKGGLTRILGKIPKIGQPIVSLIEAVRLYRRMPLVLVISSLMTVGVHCFFAIGIFLIAQGLPGDVLSLGAHFIVWSLSASTGVLPLPLGPFEFVLEFLYTHVPESGVTIAKGQGLVVALAYRLITVLIAVLGIYYYLGNRRELTQAIQESEQISRENAVIQISPSA
jgi:hypothetical protein